MLDDQDEFHDYKRAIAEAMTTRYDADVDTLLGVFDSLSEVPMPRLFTTEAMKAWERQIDAFLFKRFGIKRRKKDGQRNVP